MTAVCTLASSSKGNAAYICAGETKLLVDAGLSMRRLTQSLRALGCEPGELSAVLITHEHSDHVKGLPLLAGKTEVPVFASRGTSRAVRFQYQELEGRITPFFAGESFSVGDVSVRTFPTSHDSAESVGYIIEAEGKKIVIATDIGKITKEVSAAVAGADLLLLEANHDIERLWTGPYPMSTKKRILGDRGHLNNEDSAQLALTAARSGTRRIVLIHLSEENNTPALALEAVGGALRKEFPEGILLEAAPAQMAGKVYII